MVGQDRKLLGMGNQVSWQRQNHLILTKAPGVTSGADVDCSKAACQTDCECSLQQCASEIDACLAAPNCASSQDCALACPCADNACILKCAASTPSIKALPVAKCINSKCDSALKSSSDVDCTKATCQSQC